jgi:hypothetical protein
MALVQSNGFWHHRKLVCSNKCAIQWIEGEHLRINPAVQSLPHDLQT